MKEIKEIAVIGAGTMGPGIAQSYAMGGYNVRLYTRHEETIEKAKKIMETNLGTFIEEKMLSEDDARLVKNRISYHLDLADAVDGVQFIQETVAEKPEVKTSVYKEIDVLAAENTIIVSNASALNPFEFIPEKRLPYFTTAHWYAPPQIIPLVEVAKGEQTSEHTMEAVLELLKKSGKTPVRMEKFVPGYIINRLQILLNTEVFYLLDNGICTPEQLDLAVKASLMPRGMVLGLVQRYDFTGLDISANNIKNGSYVMPETSKHPKALFEHVEKGELGVKTGKGFYDYSDRDISEVLKKRDKLLFKVFRNTKELIEEKI